LEDICKKENYATNCCFDGSAVAGNDVCRLQLQEEADQLLELIDSVSGIVNRSMSLMEIIDEGAADFFSGRNSAQEVARIVQNRASIYIAEQS